MLVFNSNSKITKIIGIVAGVIALLFAMIFLLVGEARVFTGSMALGLSFISIICLTYKCHVNIDPENKMVEKSVSMRLWSKTVQYMFSDFNQVQILSGANSSGEDVAIKYLVHLTGSSKICIPETIGSLDFSVSKGREIADVMGVPLEEEPKMAFILNIFERCT